MVSMPDSGLVLRPGWELELRRAWQEAARLASLSRPKLVRQKLLWRRKKLRGKAGACPG